MDNTSTKDGANVSHSFPLPGIHSVQLLVESSKGCRDSIVKQINISPAPVADFLLDGNSIGPLKFVKCDDSRQINFINKSTDNSTNQWMFDKYGTSKEISPTFVFPDTGSFYVKLIINEGTLCSDSQKIQVDVLPDIKPDFSYSTACEKNEILLKNLSLSPLNDIINASWLLDNQENKIGNQISHIFGNSGQHLISLFVQSKRGCKDSIQKSIDVFPLPIVDFDFPEACLNQSMKINNTSKGVGASQIQSYYWILNNTTSIEQYPFVTYDSPGVFPIKLKATTVEGCKDSISKDVLVRDIVVPIIDPSKLSSCQYDWVIFDGTHSTGNYQYYSWDFGNGQVSNSGKDSVQYLAGGDYHISLMLTDKLCGEFTSESEFKITTAPVIDIGDDFALCPLLTKPISLSSDILNLDSVVWNSGENNIWEIIANGNSGTVIVETYYKECHISDTLQIIPKCDINAPQAFSPNGDGQNDYFNLIPDNVQSFELSLFNRWGQLIFQTNNLSQSWDGTFQGLAQPMDNYTYYAKGTKIDGTEFAIQGAVLLVR